MGSEKVLINDWCQQFPSHSVGDIAFGKDGQLYMTGGDGASFNYVDYGQTGNPCGDPPGGGSLTVPTAEGGALRSQDIRTNGDPLGLSGSLIRVDPASGNPSSDPNTTETNQSILNQKRIVAYGLRNPFRIAIRPGTNDVWIADVGWDRTEEINRVGADPTPNFGWPCYEGTVRRYDNGLNLCNSLFSSGGATAPYFSYEHGAPVDPTDGCSATNGSAVTGLRFYQRVAAQSAAFPAAYDGALFFGDNSRSCIWVMKPGTNGLPDPAGAKLFEPTQQGVVDIELGPDGALYYVSLDGSRIYRIAYESSNRAPTARVSATPDHGAAPLTTLLDARASRTRIRAISSATPGISMETANSTTRRRAMSPGPHFYVNPGSYNPAVRVTDREGETSTKSVGSRRRAPPSDDRQPGAGRGVQRQ